MDHIKPFGPLVELLCRAYRPPLTLVGMALAELIQTIVQHSHCAIKREMEIFYVLMAAASTTQTSSRADLSCHAWKKTSPSGVRSRLLAMSANRR
mmetsp:Transcript_33760/g.54382  ORF Transcript_33760/g.54382 Transcript_33760/m.54382 type:complete len:95 (-) Transcript_33760:3223-3507(-)